MKINSYVILLRGINVGGKNKVPMVRLKQILEANGFKNVITYIQSGNVILNSNLSAERIAQKIEKILKNEFVLDSKVIKTLTLGFKAYKEIVDNAPENFGEDIFRYRYNVIFLIGVSPFEAMKQIETREGVDMVWQGKHVIYFRNSIVNASKSRLSRMTQRPIYPLITIRNWNTTKKILDILRASSNIVER